ncbi:UBX domain-containing protein 3 [Elsinoe fawcettii]|nr:UBX domain-containing protein 3 [Elsinoe fawcettii]
MFFQGDLQSGIALAVQQSKLVACLVVKENDSESHKWEKEWFGSEAQAPDTNPTFGDLLSAKAVILRLFSGSEEVNLLSAFCTVDKVPKLVIINNGTVIVDIESGASEEELAKVTPKLIDILAQDTEVTKAIDSLHLADKAEEQPRSQITSPSLIQQIYQPAVSEEEKREAEKEARKAIARARREQAERAAAGEDVTPAWKRNWVEHQRVRQREAAIEREAIRRTIAEDRERINERRRGSKSPAQTPDTTPKMASSAAPIPEGNACALHIRLFDGTSIRSKFNADSTLTTAVRTFVNSNSNTDTPYNFRIMDLPKPARTIEISEENQSLRELGLCPNATLVLVPVRDFTDAYASQGAAGVVHKGINLGYNVAYGAFSIVGGIFSKVTGYPSDPETAEGPYIAGTGDNPDHLVSKKDQKRPAYQSSNTPGIKVTTLADQKGKQPAEFYNGNTTNVQPRPDDQKRE